MPAISVDIIPFLGRRFISRERNPGPLEPTFSTQSDISRSEAPRRQCPRRIQRVEPMNKRVEVVRASPNKPRDSLELREDEHQGLPEVLGQVQLALVVMVVLARGRRARLPHGVLLGVGGSPQAVAAVAWAAPQAQRWRQGDSEHDNDGSAAF